MQRKVGPGQYIGSNASDPAFVIGDLSSVWLIANVRETEASKVQVGQAVQFKILALADRAFETTISYATSSVDPNTRRLPVRANLKNAAGALKPEMFANVQVVVGESEVAAAVPRAAVIYEGETARVWVVDDNHGMELRNIRTGTTNNNLVQVLHPAILEPCRFLRELPPPDG